MAVGVLNWGSEHQSFFRLENRIDQGVIQFSIVVQPFGWRPLNKAPVRERIGIRGDRILITSQALAISPSG
jgi:hypothetical protein